MSAARELRAAVRLLAGMERGRAGALVTRGRAGALDEQPFDSLLLARSPLYRRSRREFVAAGGTFAPALLSSPRTLGSIALLSRRLEYSPVASELRFAALDSREARDPERLLELRTYVTSLFHEQNHRLLWDWLPPPPASGAALRRYLNFVEAVVVALDMALADGLGALARPLYLCGSIYDPGTEVRGELGRKRDYRNYLQAAMHATFLNLELYEPAWIARAAGVLFPALGSWAPRAAARATRLDRAFVERTNPIWQRRHSREVARRFHRAGALGLGADPLDNRQQYLLFEGVLDRMGL
jgi:hypothetical protein